MIWAAKELAVSRVTQILNPLSVLTKNLVCALMTSNMVRENVDDVIVKAVDAATCIH